MEDMEATDRSGSRALVPTSSAPDQDPGSAPDERAASQTLDRGLRLLELLGETREPLSLNELSAEAGLHRSVVYRLLRTLADHNLVTHTVHGYVLGVGAHTLGRRTFPVLQTIAKPEIANLAMTVGLTAFFVVRDGEEAVTLVSVEIESSRTRVVYTPDDRHPLTIGSPGLAILAGCPARPGERREVTVARTAGYARTRNEVLPDLATLAAPVRSASGAAVAAVAIAHVTEVIGERQIRAVTDTARMITGRILRLESTGAHLPGIS